MKERERFFWLDMESLEEKFLTDNWATFPKQILINCRIFGIRICQERRRKWNKLINLFSKATGIQQTSQFLQKFDKNRRNDQFVVFLPHYWRDWSVCSIPATFSNKLITLLRFHRPSEHILIPKMRQSSRIVEVKSLCRI